MYWGAFTGLELDKDHDSARIIAALKEIPEVTECYYITGGYTLYVKLLARDHEHMRRYSTKRSIISPGYPRAIR